VPDGVLEIDRISKRYGEVVALQNMSFDVRAGELFGFVGSNGAGKTTTMRIALGVLAADSGEVRWNGRAVDLDTRRRIGYMPEERGLYPRMKVLDQLVYLAELHGMSTNEAHTSAENWISRLGLRDRRTDEVQRLSLGNQQRVQLAAALVHEPDVLVLDEPFSGLDPVAVDVMSQVLREKASSGVPVVFSSHQLDLVERICDDLVIIADGQVVAAGPVAQLRSERAGARYRLVLDDDAGWLRDVPNLTVLDVDGSRALLELSDPSADQHLLSRALERGPVREFSRVIPALADIYREVAR
jgi:ABC-2 type transport system ATP-binding protein